MNQPLIDKIVQAMLYEGYVLYPYRSSSAKNRQRWSFGGICPPGWCERHPGSDSPYMQAQCLLRGADDATVRVKIRFLQLINRTTPSGAPGESWQEAAEREIEVNAPSLSALSSDPPAREFHFPHAIAEARDETGAAVNREQRAISGSIQVSAQRKMADVFQLTVRIENRTSLDAECCRSRDDAMMRSLVSTHVVLSTDGAAFVSQTDPPEALGPMASACRNVGCWPVLVGDAGQTDCMLASPIILYDYPRIAPESPGDLFDATEIDEILTLRVLTLTDEEKHQAAAGDARVREMLARTEALARGQLAGLHGAIRGMRPAALEEHHA